jgi:hypothetical protein
MLRELMNTQNEYSLALARIGLSSALYLRVIPERR